MITGQRWKLLDAPSRNRIVDNAFQILSRHGARIENEGILRRLEADGCSVDSNALRARFPDGVVRRTIEHYRGRDYADLLSDDVCLDVPWNPIPRVNIGGAFPQFLEWPDCRKRPATIEDVRRDAKMAHVLEEINGAGPSLTCSEVPQEIEPLWNLVERMSVTDKPAGIHDITCPELVPYMVRLGEVVSGEPGSVQFVSVGDAISPPLRLGRRTLLSMLAKAEVGVPVLIGIPMLVSGATGPVTLAGTVSLIVAELLAYWTVARLIAPDTPVKGIVGTGAMDFRTTRCNMGSPEALVQGVAACEICRDEFGIFARWTTNYGDRKRPGIYGVYEKMFTLATCPFACSLGIGASGLLCNGMAYSPVQLLLELDLTMGLKRFAAGFEVNDETLALDVIGEALERGTDFISTDHTVAHFRREQWYPKWIDRTMWQDDEVEKGLEEKMLREIDNYWKDAVSRYERPDIDEGRLAEARKVLAAAEKDLAGVEIYT